MTPNAALDAKPTFNPKLSMSTRQSRVLVVDDERHIARLLEFILLRAGYLVATAHDGLSAARKAREWTPDAILLDLALPGQSGLDVLKDLRADPNDALSRTVVIVLTARSFDEMPMVGGEIKADSYCTKPVAPSDLLKTLEDLNVPPRLSSPSPSP